MSGTRGREAPDSPANERAIYAPDDPTVTVGGEPFAIGALTPRLAFELDRLLARIAGAVAVTGGGDLLASTRYEDKLLLVAAILHRPARPIDPAWVEAHASPLEQLRVLATWLERTDVREYLGEAASLLRLFRPQASANGSASPASAG